MTHVGTNDQNGVVDPVEVKPIQARNPIMVYGQYFSAAEITQVNLYLVTDPAKETVQFVGRGQYPDEQPVRDPLGRHGAAGG
ncbi:MAG: hypothetical protein MZV65_29010 [Chromatiales bacterium]|nr:hypothetical protein [Chromatiales bacterium]